MTYIMLPSIQPVFDLFHIVKNFDDKVISAIRKDEQNRLKEQGDEAGAAALKKTKYILTSSKKTLCKKDEEAAAGKPVSRGATLFEKPEITRKPGNMERYDSLLRENELFFTLDIIKEKLTIKTLRRQGYGYPDDDYFFLKIFDASRKR